MRGIVGRPWLARYAVAAAIYSLAFVLCFPSTAAHPGTTIVSGFSDATSTLRDYWAESVQHKNPLTFTHDALMGAPEGRPRAPLTVVANGAIQTAFVWELRGALGLIGAWNAFMFLGFLATGLAMFALLEQLGCRLLASLFGGYVFAFCPYALERAHAGQIGLLQNWVFPLLAIVLLGLRERRSRRSAVAVGLTIAVAFYVSVWQGLFAVTLAVVFFLTELVRGRTRGERARTLTLGAVAAGASLLAISPVIALYELQGAAVIAMSDFYSYGATMAAYFLPSRRNPLLHALAASVPPQNLTEESLFFGYTTWALALVAIVLLVRRNEWLSHSAARRATAIFAIALAAVAFFASLPSHEPVGGVSLPMPSEILSLTTRVVRLYSRFGLLVGFSLALLAALALTVLMRGKSLGSRLIGPLACLLVVIELLPGDAGGMNASAKPAWVEWLARQPPGIVASYPWQFGPSLVADSWYQVYDRDPQFDVIGTTRRQQAIRLLARDILAPVTAGVLSTEGVRYVVVHDDVYRTFHQGTPALDPTLYSLVKHFGAVRIFAVRPDKIDIESALQANAGKLGTLESWGPPTFAYGTGFNGPEPYQGATGRWMVQGGELTFSASVASVVTVNGYVFSNQAPRSLTLVDASGRVLGHATVPTNAVLVHLGPFDLPRGRSTLRLLASPGPQTIAPTDSREATVFLEPLSLSAVPAF